MQPRCSPGRIDRGARLRAAAEKDIIPRNAPTRSRVPDFAGRFNDREILSHRCGNSIYICYEYRVAGRMLYAIGRPKYDLVKRRTGNRHVGVGLIREIKRQQRSRHVFVCNDKARACSSLEFIGLRCKIARAARTIEWIEPSWKMQPLSVV